MSPMNNVDERLAKRLAKHASCPTCGRVSDMVDADDYERGMDMFECPDGGIDHPRLFRREDTWPTGPEAA